MPATKSTLHKAIVAQGHCWALINKDNSDTEFEVVLFESAKPTGYKTLINANRAFLTKGAANSALAIIEQVLKHSKKD